MKNFDDFFDILIKNNKDLVDLEKYFTAHECDVDAFILRKSDISPGMNTTEIVNQVLRMIPLENRIESFQSILDESLYVCNLHTINIASLRVIGDYIADGNLVISIFDPMVVFDYYTRFKSLIEDLEAGADYGFCKDDIDYLAQPAGLLTNRSLSEIMSACIAYGCISYGGKANANEWIRKGVVSN